MTLEQRLRRLADALPSDASSITLSRADLVGLLSGVTAPEAPEVQDLTVDDVGAALRRAPSTVRGWLIGGTLRGYKLNGRDWRVPRAALKVYLEAQKSDSPPDANELSGTDLGAWRQLRERSR